MEHEPRDPKRRLRLIRGGRDDGARAGIPVTVAPADRPPFEIDALVVEDDTYLVLGADPEVREPAEHPLRVWQAVHDFEPLAPGTLTVRPGRPPRLLAIVHDLAADPTWREDWVASALGEVLRYAERTGVRSLAVPPLGAVHGRLPVERFAALLRDALAVGPAQSLERIWLACPAGWRGRRERLEQALAPV